MKIMCMFATEKGLRALQEALQRGLGDSIGCVVTFHEADAVSFESELARLSAAYDLPFYMWKDAKETLPSLIERHHITDIVAIGWRYLLPLSLNRRLAHPIVVFHDSLLPRYRGFAPTPTAIICGETKTGVTILFAAEAADQGAIIWQKEIGIGQDEYVQQVIEKQAAAYAEGLVLLIAQMQKGEIASYKQDESKATYSVWRSPEDCSIDWNRSATDIFNLIRAVSAPYCGAHTLYKGKKITIRRASVLEDLPFAIRDCGKIWSMTQQGPVVLCGDGLLLIEDACDEAGDTVIFDTLRVRLK